MLLSSKTYDRLKFWALIGLPALATFYLGFGQMWELPETEKVSGTIMLVDALLGTLLQISSSQREKLRKVEVVDGGYLTNNGTDDLGRPIVGLTMTSMPDELLGAKEVTFKVAPAPPQTEAVVEPPVE